jgi:hypothetical protein
MAPTFGLLKIPSFYSLVFTFFFFKKLPPFTLAGFDLQPKAQISSVAGGDDTTM